ncbi:hypothetical protein SRHO_G00286760 [Serrasalmus rhombeus]
MSSGSAQDVAVEHFLRDIERRGQRLHCAVIGCEEEPLRGDMNLLYRKSRLDWRHRDQEGKKSSSCKDASSATVGKVRDLASFRRHFRMGFMTMPASQDLSPHSCATAMAPRSQSCHAVGTGEGGSLENGDYPDSDTQTHPNPARCPPAKPKRHPSTRLSSTPQLEHPARGSHGPPDAPPPPPPQNPPKHSEKKNAMKKSDSGEMPGRKVPPQKPKRSPSTQLSFDPPPPRVPPPATPLPFQSAEPSPHGEGGEDEPVYIEMVGQVFTRETPGTQTPHPLTPSATTPDSDSDQGEAIYEEMKYPVAEDSARDAQRRLPPKHKSSKAYHSSSISSSSASSSLPRPSSSSPSCSSSHSKPKAAVSISHSSPLPSSSSASSTPVPPQPLSASPHPPRAPTPFLLPGTKSESEIGSTSKIPAPFPNLLQHKPPLLAFPQPAAASSGISAQHKSSSAKSGSSSGQAPSSLPPTTSTSSSSSKETSGGEKEREKDRKDGQLGPAPGLRARSHSTPLPPSSKSSSPYSHHHHHHHPHHRPSHYHHYRKPEKESSKAREAYREGGPSQSSAQTQTQAKEGKSVSFLLKSDKLERERDRERDRDRDRDTPESIQADSATHTSHTGTSTTPTSSLPLAASSSSSSVTPSTSSSSQRPHSRPHLQRSHTPHLPAYKPPPSDSPLLWTYPSVGFRRPPAYDSLRGGPQLPTLQQPDGGAKGVAAATQAHQQVKAGFLPWDSSLSIDEQAYWPMHRKLSFSHSSRESEKEDGRVWNGSTDALLRRDRDDIGGGVRGTGHSGIPVRASSRIGHSESLAGADGPPGFRALPRAGLPLPCQTFPACRNGELGRLGRSSSTSGVKQAGGDVQRQSSLPAREALSQLHALSQAPCSPSLARPQMQTQQQQAQAQAQFHLQQLQQHHLQLQFQQLAQLAAQAQPPATGGSATGVPAQRDGKLLEVIERKRCLCKEIKAHRRPDKSLCKQDSMPILPSWRKTPEPRKTGTPPCQRPQAVVWDTAI